MQKPIGRALVVIVYIISILLISNNMSDLIP
jgi:hypothetical protein